MPDESIVFTFYQDTNYFLVRYLRTVSDFATGYPTPTQIPLIVSTGVKCACFNDDYSVIFLLDGGANVLMYHIASSTLQVLGTSTFFTMIACYYDPSKNSLVF